MVECPLFGDKLDSGLVHRLEQLDSGELFAELSCFVILGGDAVVDFSLDNKASMLNLEDMSKFQRKQQHLKKMYPNISR